MIIKHLFVQISCSSKMFPGTDRNQYKGKFKDYRVDRNASLQLDRIIKKIIKGGFWITSPWDENKIGNR